MRSSILPHLSLLAALTFELALPGYRYEFPRDHFSHPNYQTEWWYYTGNLTTRTAPTAPRGARQTKPRRFGFELTFFRKAVARPGKPATAWDLDDLYLAHLALSDLDGGRFYSTERLNRAGPGLAGASLEDRRIWNGNWQVRWDGERQRLQAVTGDFSFALDLDPQRPPVIHGRDGLSRKGPARGEASHYISFTRLAAAGSVTLKGERSEVSGLAWMDHEFFTHQLDPAQAGWDWMSIQLDNATELMLYRLRRREGSADPYSSGTFIDRAGRARHLEARDFAMEPLETWTSPATGARYPIHWQVRLPSLSLDLDCATPLASQEMVSPGKSGPNYWEGAVTYRGRLGSAPITGVGYLEMTGYDRPLRLD
ncbi:MAG TPA: lipocalin-like domain-containing protein [Bryobacterales bacterium]|nr:lipocalin-like domain-containing protein [Bryobacterales bacterium]